MGGDASLPPRTAAARVLALTVSANGHADPRERLLVGRLAAAVLTADGQVSCDERLVFDHVLARWRITRSMLSEAILEDAVSRPFPN